MSQVLRDHDESPPVEIRLNTERIHSWQSPRNTIATDMWPTVGYGCRSLAVGWTRRAPPDVQITLGASNTLMAHPKQSAAVESMLLKLEADAERMRKVMIEFVGPTGSPMFPLDFLAFAAVKRHASTTSAFVAMVKSWNMVVARALLRMHIDTSLRFSAAWHVAEPHAFATEVLKGERIDKLKTRAGVRLTDSHLVQLHRDKHPWLPAVYEHLSGYVHFSGAHIADAIEGLGDEDRTVHFLVSDQDLKFPEFSWVEILECFREATSILGMFLQGWGATKKLSDAQLQTLRRGS